MISPDGPTTRSLESQLSELPAKDGVRFLQGAIMATSGQRIKVDGVVGPETLRALDKVPPARRGIVESVAAATAAQMPSMVTPNDVETAIKLRKYTQVPESYVRLVLKIEPARIGENLVVTTDGKYVGLSQFSRETYEWIRMSRFRTPDGDLLPSQVLPEFDAFKALKGVDAAVAAIDAASVYYLVNRNVVQAEVRGNVRWTDPVAFLAHNQGGGGAASYLVTGKLKYPKQSDLAIEVMREALDQAIV